MDGDSLPDPIFGSLIFTHAAAIINIYKGLALVLPLVFVYLAYTFLDNFCFLYSCELLHPRKL